eukprot:4104778-Ditylum_brightwellii.AAC.1
MSYCVKDHSENLAHVPQYRFSSSLYCGLFWSASCSCEVRGHAILVLVNGWSLYPTVRKSSKSWAVMSERLSCEGGT